MDQHRGPSEAGTVMGEGPVLLQALSSYPDILHNKSNILPKGILTNTLFPLSLYKVGMAFIFGILKSNRKDIPFRTVIKQGNECTVLCGIQTNR